MAIPGYRILRKIRQGGMSTVYLAIQQSVDREVAIKVMSPNLNSDPSFSSRFYREAKIVGKLSHHNIVSIYDVGNHKHYNYIAMDYLPGMPLQDRLDQGISAPQAVRIVREMAAALHYSHDRGYVHRDIKPDNILFREDDTAVLCDFGIAKALTGSVKMTNYGSVLGTPNYMSPEQAQGKDIDGRTDIYSLGVVFYEMLTGQVPFSGDDPIAIAIKHMTAAIPKLPAQHKAYQKIIERMMDKKPANRFQTGYEVIAALDELEKSMKQGTKQYTQSGSTALQMLGLIGALFNTLTTAITVSVQRLLLSKNKFSSRTMLLSEKQQQDLDAFILHDDKDDLPEDYDDLPLIQDTIEQPAIAYRWWRLVASAVAVTAIITGFVYWPKPSSQTSEHFSTVTANETSIEATKTTLERTKTTTDTTETAPETTETTTETTATTTEASEPIPTDTQPALLDNQIITEPASEIILPTISSAPASIQQFALTINTEPSNATIQILNIKPLYYDGILLKPENYQIKVSAKNYHPKTFWVKIKNSNIQRQVNLRPIRR